MSAYEGEHTIFGLFQANLRQMMFAGFIFQQTGQLLHPTRLLKYMLPFKKSKIIILLLK
jgi:hypothetical protein